ncbi:hypothetical protein MGN70_003074 [Eutypa lata]|nr:hypothetical protein MGN70_003074 [Eutypa lata]
MNLTGQDWNTALCVFFATYALGGTPSNIALKKFGPKLWLSSLLGTCGILNVLHGVQSSMASFVVLRLLLGLVEAGIYPGCSYVLTNWYSPAELHTRLTLFYSGASLASAFSGLLAYAIGHLDHTWGYRGWRFIYVIEGMFSVLMAVLGYFLLAPNPAKVKGWLTEEEKQFLVLRNRYARSGDSRVREEETFSWKYVKQSFRSVHVYSLALSEFTLCVTVYGISFVLPSIISNLGYSAVQAQAMTAPPYVFACVIVVLSGWAADRWQQRALSVIVPNILAAAGFLLIIISIRYTSIPGVTYFGIFFMAAGLYCISPAVSAWIALNTAGDMKRAVSMGLMISMSQLGGIVSSNIFLSREVAIPEQQIWEQYSEQELADLGDLSPLFRYAS